jgi:broad-specificity NMP kinase
MSDDLGSAAEPSEEKKLQRKTMMKLLSKKTIIGSLQDQPLSKMTSMASPSSPGGDELDSLDFSGFAGDYSSNSPTTIKKRSFVGSMESNTNKRNTFLGKSIIGSQTVPKFSKTTDLAPGNRELEDQIEEEQFMQAGKGEVHVLCAIKAYEISNQGETKVYKYLTIARDACGAYALFVVAPSPVKNKKTQGISIAYPILGIKNEMIPMDGPNSTTKFFLDLDGVTIAYLTHTQLREKFVKALAFACEPIQKANGLPLIFMRMASMDFVFDYTGCRQRPQEGSIESVLSEIIRTNNPNDEEMSNKFRALIRDIHSRDAVMTKLCDYVLKNDTSLGQRFDEKRVRLILHLIEYMIDVPYLSYRTTELRDRILLTLDTILNMGEAEEKRVQHVIVKSASVFAAMQAWKGRSSFPNEPFPEDFFSLTIRNTRSEAIKRRQSVRHTDVVSKLKRFTSEVLLGTIICTTDGEMIGDQQMYIPMVPIEHVMAYQVRNMTSSDDVFRWLLQLSHNKQLTYWAKALANQPFESSVLKRSFLAAVRAMSETFQNLNVGILYDNVVKLDLLQNSVLFITVCVVKDKNEIGALPRGYQWLQTHLVEQETYVRFHSGVDELTPMEKLSSQTRWINSAIKLALTPCMPKGVHIGYTRFVQTFDGYHILTTTDRSTIPHTHVSSQLLTPDQWKQVLQWKSKLETGESIIPEDCVITSDSPGFVCNSFEDFFIRAWLRLQEESGQKTFGKLYDVEAIMWDETKETQMILFAEYVDEMTLSDKEQQLMWLRGTTFEFFQNLLYNPTSYDKYMKALRTELGDHMYVNACRHSMDEMVMYRSPESEKLQIFMKKEQAWLPKRWALRVIEWFVSKLVPEQIILSHAPTIQEALDLMKPEQNKTWEQIEELLFDIGGDVKKKKKLVVERFDQRASSQQEDKELEKIICTVYDVDAVMEDIIDIENLMAGPTREELADYMIQETFELAMIDTLDAAELYAIQSKLDEVISVIETVQLLCDDTVFDARLDESYVEVHGDRIRFQNERIQKNIDPKDTSNPMAVFSDDESSRSYDTVVRDTVRIFTANLEKVETMMEVIRSAQESIELCEAIHELETTLNQQEDALKSLEMVYNLVPLNRRESVGFTNQQDRFITWNGDRSREGITSIDKDLGFLSNEDDMNEDDADLRISEFLNQQERKMTEREQAIQKQLKKHVLKTPFGYQGFSIADDDAIVNEVVAQTPSKSPQRRMSVSSDESSLKQEKENSPERKSWFGYQTPDHMKRRAELLMKKKSWRMADNKLGDKHYNKYKNQENVAANLQNMMSMYTELKLKSSILVDDHTVSHEEYERFVQKLIEEEKKAKRSLSSPKRKVQEKSKSYTNKVGLANRKVNKQLTAHEISLFEMSNFSQYNN